MPGILPEMSIEESLDVTRIYSIADQLSAGTLLIKHRPFRAPHHTISPAGLVGGGNIPKLGEISLAHRGVLFLDEFPEFGTRAQDGLVAALATACSLHCGDQVPRRDSCPPSRLGRGHRPRQSHPG